MKYVNTKWLHDTNATNVVQSAGEPQLTLVKHSGVKGIKTIRILCHISS